MTISSSTKSRRQDYILAGGQKIIFTATGSTLEETTLSGISVDIDNLSTLIVTVSGVLQDEIDLVYVSLDDYATLDNLTTTSGIIVAQIPTDFYTTAEVDTTVSGLQAAIDAITGWSGEIPTVSGTITVLNGLITDYS